MRTHRLSSLGPFTAGLSILLVACASSTPSRSLTLEPDPPLEVNRPMVGRRAILTRADLASVRGPISTLEAVRRLRPEFLSPSDRAVGRTTSDMSLYVNDVYEGDVWQLNSLPLYLILEITFLHPSEATARFGTRCRCSGGAISVRTLIRDNAPRGLLDDDADGREPLLHQLRPSRDRSIGRPQSERVPTLRE